VNRYALRDDQWEQIKDLLPGKPGNVGVTAGDNRRFVEAVLFRYRAGIPWRDPWSGQGQACMGHSLSRVIATSVPAKPEG
jgi:transposase